MLPSYIGLLLHDHHIFYCFPPPPPPLFYCFPPPPPPPHFYCFLHHHHHISIVSVLTRKPLLSEVFNIIEAKKSVYFVSSKYHNLVEFKRSANMILESMQSTVAKLTERVNEIVVAADNLEEYSYQCAVKLLGVLQQETNETSYQCAKCCLNIFHEMGADEISLQDIDIAHRLPSRLVRKQN